MIIIGIDPGVEKSGIVSFDTDTAAVYPQVDKNEKIRESLKIIKSPHIVVQEMPASYGMAVGRRCVVKIGRAHV